MADDWLFWSGFGSVAVGVLTFGVHQVIKDRKKAASADTSLFAYAVDMPDKTEWDAVVLEKPSDVSSPAFEEWTKKAMRCLKERARAGLRPLYNALKDVNHYAFLRQKSPDLVHPQTWASVQEAFKAIKAEVSEVQDHANILRPGMPGWGSAIHQKVYNEERHIHKEKMKKKKEAEEAKSKRRKRKGSEASTDGDDDKDEESEDEDENEDWVVYGHLRFDVGQRVECNMGEKGFQPGTIVGNWSLPYTIALDRGDTCFAPTDADKLVRALVDGPERPATVDLRLCRPFNHKLGDIVRVRISPQAWAIGGIVAVNYREPSWPPQRVAAYQVKVKKNDGTDALLFCQYDRPDLIVAHKP